MLIPLNPDCFATFGQGATNNHNVTWPWSLHWPRVRDHKYPAMPENPVPDDQAAKQTCQKTGCRKVQWPVGYVFIIMFPFENCKFGGMPHVSNHNIYIPLNIYIYIYTYVYMYISIYTYMYMYMYIYIYVCACVHRHIYTNIHIHIYMFTYLHICTCIYLSFTYLNIYKYTYTNIHMYNVYS